jgi:SAM-dependent methyltransferase
MGNECSKAVVRRMHQPGFVSRYFVGNGIDIGSGTDALGNSDGLGKYQQQFPLMTSCRGWDVEQGDAQEMKGVSDEFFDFVHSSHTLEHMKNPYTAIRNWFRILKPGGHLIITIPDEDLYEQGQGVITIPGMEGKAFYSNYNGDHKTTYTLYKSHSWSPVSINVTYLVTGLGPHAQLIKMELLDHTYQYELPPQDQTGGIAECAIEFIIRKRF